MDNNKHQYPMHPFRKLPALLRYACMFLTVCGLVFLLVLFTPLVQSMASLLAGPWGNPDGDVLVVLGGETIQGTAQMGTLIGVSSYWRSIYAATVWKEAHFRHLLLSGSESGESMKRFLIAYGVPESAVLLEDKSGTTHENAIFSKPVLDKIGGRIVLLTSEYHMYRASRCFAKAGLKVQPLPFPDVTKRAAASIPYRLEGFWVLVDELTKIAYYCSKGWI